AIVVEHEAERALARLGARVRAARDAVLLGGLAEDQPPPREELGVQIGHQKVHSFMIAATSASIAAIWTAAPTDVLTFATSATSLIPYDAATRSENVIRWRSWRRSNAWRTRGKRTTNWSQVAVRISSSIAVTSSPAPSRIDVFATANAPSRN